MTEEGRKVNKGCVDEQVLIRCSWGQFPCEPPVDGIKQKLAKFSAHE